MTITMQNGKEIPCPPATAQTPRRSASHAVCLEVLDVLMTSLVIGPCAILYWKGTWELAGILVNTGDPIVSAWISLVIGVVGHLSFTFGQSAFERTFHPDKYRLTYYIATRVYTYFYAWVCVNAWRGGWMLFDTIPYEKTFIIEFAITLVAVMILALTRTVRNMIAPPVVLSVDRIDGYFKVVTMFKSRGFKQPVLHVLDTLLSIFGISSVVLLTWRGIWIILDTTIYPENFQHSAWCSLSLGYTIIAVAFALQSVLQWICNQIEGVGRLIIADIFLFITALGSINVWRAIFMLMDVYVPKDYTYTFLWIAHIGCFLILMLMNCSNSVLFRGVYIDAEESSGDCVVFPVSYIRLFFERERTKKYQKGLCQDIECQRKLITDKQEAFAIEQIAVGNGEGVKPFLNQNGTAAS